MVAARKQNIINYISIALLVVLTLALSACAASVREYTTFLKEDCVISTTTDSKTGVQHQSRECTIKTRKAVSSFTASEPEHVVKEKEGQ